MHNAMAPGLKVNQLPRGKQSMFWRVCFEEIAGLDDPQALLHECIWSRVTEGFTDAL